jgi:ketosteroid isomerase-like protein
MRRIAPVTRAVVQRFYDSFSASDGEGMARCHDPDITFEDPVFGVLHGSDAGDMWRMLCGAATDLRIDYVIESADERAAEIAWTARYTFSATGRPVVNRVHASMRLRDGRILDHRDRFSFWRWSSQALGVPGALLGWSPVVKRQVRATALKGLRAFQQRTD